MKTGTYYCGRILKFGEIKTETIIERIASSKVRYRGETAWAFAQQYMGKEAGIDFVFATLYKFQPQGSVKQLNLERQVAVEKPEKNLVVSQCPFVYIPKYQGIAFLHVSNHFEVNIFRDRFRDLIVDDDVLIDCQIDMISDLRSFAAKLESLDTIIRISAIVSPPNPLFGDAWKELEEYLRKRAANKLRFDEKASMGNGLRTNIKTILQIFLNRTSIKDAGKVDITDAAILMAADGYGNGLITGKSGETTETIRTSKTVRNFDFDRDPDPTELFKKAVEILEDINNERYLGH